MDSKRGIGFENSIPWKIKEDFAHFKKTTLSEGASLIMGRKTWEGLPVKWLKGRNLWVLTSSSYGWVNGANKEDNCSITFIDKIEDLPQNTETLWVCGGKQIYELFVPKTTEYLVSHVKGEFPCDVFMPEFESKFKNVESILTHEKFEVKRYFN